jgi:hypothetical protein
MLCSLLDFSRDLWLLRGKVQPPLRLGASVCDVNSFTPASLRRRKKRLFARWRCKAYPSDFTRELVGGMEKRQQVRATHVQCNVIHISFRPTTHYLPFKIRDKRRLPFLGLF